MTDTDTDEDDLLDAPCDPTDDHGDPTPDDDVDGVVLFADLDPDDNDAVEARRAEWVDLAALDEQEADDGS